MQNRLPLFHIVMVVYLTVVRMENLNFRFPKRTKAAEFHTTSFELPITNQVIEEYIDEQNIMITKPLTESVPVSSHSMDQLIDNFLICKYLSFNNF